MPRKTLNNDQELIVYCLVARLRDTNYNSGYKGFEFVSEEIKKAVQLYVEVSGLTEDYRNRARKKFDKITREEVENKKAEGIVNTYRLTAENEIEKFYEFIRKRILPSKLSDKDMEFWGDRSNSPEVSNYFKNTISCLNYREGAYKHAVKRHVEGREDELIPCGRINKDLLSQFDTFLKKIARKIQFDNKLLKWIRERVRIESPYHYRAVKPSIKSIITELKSEYSKDELKNKKLGYLLTEVVNNYELADEPEYLLEPAKYRDNMRKHLRYNFRLNE